MFRPPSILQVGVDFTRGVLLQLRFAARLEPKLVEIKPAHFAACIRISPDQPHIESVAPAMRQDLN
jgi:hypothetical protein